MSTSISFLLPSVCIPAHLYGRDGDAAGIYRRASIPKTIATSGGGDREQYEEPLGRSWVQRDLISTACLGRVQRLIRGRKSPSPSCASEGHDVPEPTF